MTPFPIQYAAAGIRVLPLHWPSNGRCSCGRDCASPAKHPLLPHGVTDATADLEVVTGWMQRWPNSNWGMVPPPGVIVVDIDPRNGGDREIVSLQRTHGPLPPTLTATTGSGGAHLWFLYTGPLRGKLGVGVDIKSATGYVVAPPSRHSSGGVYEWLDADQEAAPAPAWFRTILAPPRPAVGPVRHTGGRGLDGLVAFVAASEEGARNSRLFWAACRAHESGLDPEPLIDAAVGVGLPRDSATRTVQSAANQPRRKAAR